MIFHITHPIQAFGSNKGFGIKGKSNCKKVYFWSKVLREINAKHSLTAPTAQTLAEIITS
jgi:hypothetical protein